MNAVEIEEAISALALEPFDPAEFPCAFLEAVEKIRDGTITQYCYDAKTASLALRP